MARRNKTQILIDKYVNETFQKASGDMLSVLNEVNNELYNESTKMYDSLIDQFYSYKTSSYIRHGQHRPGTRMGENLYRANNISRTWGLNPSLTIKLDGSDMEEGYRFDSAINVFENISAGVRFPFFADRNLKFENVDKENYSASHLFYEGKLFAYSGTINSIFRDFDKDFDNMSYYLFYQKWKKTKWCN